MDRILEKGSCLIVVDEDLDVYCSFYLRSFVVGRVILVIVWNLDLKKLMVEIEFGFRGW